MGPGLKLRIVPARQGASWVRQGFEVFWRRPFGFAALFAALLLLFLLLDGLEPVGQVLLLVGLPVGSLSFMIAARAVLLQGRFPALRLLGGPLNGPAGQRIAILKLGVVYALAVLAIGWLGGWIDGGTLDALMNEIAGGKATPQGVAERLIDGRLQAGLWLRLTLAALLSVPFWHAPALLHWGRQGVAQALFSSTVACWRNRGAFTIFGLAWAGVIMAAALLIDLVAALSGQTRFVALLAVPCSLMFTTVFYASVYFTVAGSFELPPDPALENPA